MHFIKDHLIAIAIFGAAGLILASLQLKSSTAGIEATEFYAQRTSTLDLIRMMNQDFVNIGSDVPLDDQTILSWSADAPTVVFEFQGAVAPESSAVVERVRYQVVPTEVIEVTLTGQLRNVQCYRVERSIYQNGEFQPAGQSGNLVTSFEIRLLAEGMPLVEGAHLDTATELQVAMTSLIARGPRASVAETRWTTRYALNNLR
jgi:hypothetical protein